MNKKGGTMTTLTRNQKRSFTKTLNDGSVIVVEIRHDDECRNGHNTFAVTADHYDRQRRNGEPSIMNDNHNLRWLGSCGCQHELVAKHFPQLRKAIKYHLFSTDGPMYYIENTIYHANNGDLDYARSTACWPNATLKQLQDKRRLNRRLPRLMKKFRVCVESFGFTY